MAIDNHKLILPFVPVTDDGDTFIYTETIDRAAGKGSNTHRVLKTFYHRSQAEFLKQFEVIKWFCEASSVRAYTRLAPRSLKKVGKQFTRLVVEASLNETYGSMKNLYNKACGTVSPNHKIWLYDIDGDEDMARGEHLAAELELKGLLLGVIPSRKGFHILTPPHDLREWSRVAEGMTLHKDNPTNLYIPDGAA